MIYRVPVRIIKQQLAMDGLMIIIILQQRLNVIVQAIKQVADRIRKIPKLHFQKLKNLCKIDAMQQIKL